MKGGVIEMTDREIVVKDIKMSFGSMVVFMVKWAVATIPAAIILFLMVSFLSAFLMAFMR